MRGVEGPEFVHVDPKNTGRVLRPRATNLVGLGMMGIV
jgi:hypothetical protein